MWGQHRRPGANLATREPEGRESRQSRLIRVLVESGDLARFSPAARRAHIHGGVSGGGIVNGGRLRSSALAERSIVVTRFHDLRHSYATLLLREGVHPKIVQERLGHSRIEVTLDTYSHILPGMQEGAEHGVVKRLGLEGIRKTDK